MMLYTVAIVLVHAVLAVQGLGSNPFHRERRANDIEALCAGKTIALHTINELFRVAGNMECSGHVVTAAADLYVLINQTKGDICAQKSINKLGNYYAEYLDTSSKESKKVKLLPESLKRFALAYGMQMSGSCKRRMVLALVGYNGLGGILQSHKAILGLVSDKSPVAEMLQGLTDADEILLPGDLAPYLKDKQQVEGANIGDDKMYIQTATAPYIRKMQALCNEKFAPVYRPLIRPIIRLNNMGFNYKDKHLRNTMDDPKVSLELAQWTRLVFLCESLNNIRVIDVPATADANDTARKTMRILTSEEAKALEGGKDLSEPEVKELTYEPMEFVNDVIYNEEDRKLKKAIKRFSTSKSEDERAAKRMLGKGISMFKTQFKRHNIGLLLSTGFKALVYRVKTGKNLKMDVSSEIVKVLDGAIGHEEEYLAQSNVDKWEAAQDIAREIGGALAVSVMGIMYIAVWVLVIGVIVMQGILIAHLG